MNKKGIISVLIVLALVGFSLGCTSSNSNSNSSSSNKTSTNCEFKDVSFYDSGNQFSPIGMSGNVRWTDKDHSHALLSADLNLKDGTTDSISILKTWSDIQKDKWYKFDGLVVFTSTGSENPTTISDVKTIDIKDNKKVVYTWKNE